MNKTMREDIEMQHKENTNKKNAGQKNMQQNGRAAEKMGTQIKRYNHKSD